MKHVAWVAVLSSLLSGYAGAQSETPKPDTKVRSRVAGLRATVFRASSRGNYVLVYDQNFNRNVVSLDAARVTRVGKNVPIQSADELRGGDTVVITGQVAPL